jgi:Predicted tRNA(5-methylaminomethyl-2-thiouridylate) methyltransferase, contains the PP-loop ATPase domain
LAKALALLSGGLDSTLAIRVIQQQGIEVIALNFVTVFCRCTSHGSCKLEAVKVSEKFGIPIKVINTTERFLELVKKPKFGYGKNMNPCIDCRINIFRIAGEYMREIGADFIITGEVLGQRPMSQRKEAMKIIDKEANLTGLVLRPLCAKHMEPTIPEKTGLVDREKLLQIRGRSRKDQIQLADVFQIKDYPCSAGGCLLTDPEFAHRMRDLVNSCDAGVNDVNLLKVGRHFRLDQQTKAIVGRNEEDNARIESLSQEGDILLTLVDMPGPLTLLRGEITEEKIYLAARVTARYGKSHVLPTSKVSLRQVKNDVPHRVIEVVPMGQEEADNLILRKIFSDKISHEPSPATEFNVG